MQSIRDEQTFLKRGRGRFVQGRPLARVCSSTLLGPALRGPALLGTAVLVPALLGAMLLVPASCSGSDRPEKEFAGIQDPVPEVAKASVWVPSDFSQAGRPKSIDVVNGRLVITLPQGRIIADPNGGPASIDPGLGEFADDLRASSIRVPQKAIDDFAVGGEPQVADELRWNVGAIEIIRGVSISSNGPELALRIEGGSLKSATYFHHCSKDCGGLGTLVVDRSGTSTVVAGYAGRDAATISAGDGVDRSVLLSDPLLNVVWWVLVIPGPPRRVEFEITRRDGTTEQMQTDPTSYLE